MGKGRLVSFPGIELQQLQIGLVRLRPPIKVEEEMGAVKGCFRLPGRIWQNSYTIWIWHKWALLPTPLSMPESWQKLHCWKSGTGRVQLKQVVGKKHPLPHLAQRPYVWHHWVNHIHLASIWFYSFSLGYNILIIEAHENVVLGGAKVFGGARLVSHE